jgi:hypothetical protein
VKRYSYFLHSIGAAALLSSVAVAEPVAGTVVSIPIALIVCDTEQNVLDLASAGKKSNEDLRTKYEELNKLQDAKGEPTCALMPLAGAFGILAVDPLGQLEDGDGVKGDAYAVHLGNPQGADIWVLWGEKTPQPEGSSL